MDISTLKNIAVIGAGDMGHGIAEVALIAGYKVYLHDITPDFLERGVSRMMNSLEKLVAKGKVDKDHFEKIKGELLVSCIEIKDAVETADLIIEAVPEIMALKKKIFEQVEAHAPEHAIIASNTSTMKISELADVVKRPDKFLGLHYFNPAVLMKLVEVIRGDKTSDETMQIGYDFVLKNAKVPVRVEKDSPGFIVNRVQAPAVVLLNSILDKKVALPEQIDAVMRKLGLPMGPFETMDYTGLDINVNGADYFAKAIHPDFKAGKIISELVTAGNLGKKTEKGFFDWSNGRPFIDLEKATDKFDPMDLVAVNANEATKIVEKGVCTLADVDTAIINATGNPFGLIAMIKDIKPEELVKRLENLADQFNKEIFKPTDMIKKGGYIPKTPKNIHVGKTGYVATITIDHPPANSWNLETMNQFEKAVDEVETDKEVRVVILTGAGEKCFSAGFDVSDAVNVAEISKKGRILWQRIDQFSKPIIAALNGFAMGGGLELAMCCHFRIMAGHPKNKIGLTELNLGILPGWGGTQTLARIVGKPKALEMILLSERIDAKKALEIGLINRVSTPENLEKDTLALAEKLAERPPIAVAGVLKAMSAGEYEGRTKGWEVEAHYTELTSQSADAQEGFMAFFEKRTPKFKGA